jgi:hypothetical protein
MLTLRTPEFAEKFVAEQQKVGNDVEWDGWDIVFYRPDPASVYTKDGVWRNGGWAFKNVSPLNDDGRWTIDPRNVRRTRRPRNRS